MGFSLLLEMVMKLNKTVFAIASLAVTAAPLSFTTTAYAQDRTRTHVEAPEYPRGAERRGIEGSVTVTYSISAEGDVVNAEVTEANPEGIFDRAAVSAISDWRYEPAAAQTDGHSQTLQFRLN